MKFIDCNLIFLRSYRGYTFKGFVSFFFIHWKMTGLRVVLKTVALVWVI